MNKIIITSVSYLYLIFIEIISPLYGQTNTITTPEVVPTNTTPEVVPTNTNTTKEVAPTNTNTTKEETPEMAIDMGIDAQKQLELAWAISYTEAKEKFRLLAVDQSQESIIEIVEDVPNKSLTIKKDDILYKYLFYKKQNPSKKQRSLLQKMNDDTMGDEMVDNSRFFCREIFFPLVPSADLYEKIKMNYGKHTKSSLSNKSRGSYVWDMQENYIIQIIEAYNQKPFTRQILYIHKELRNEIMKDLEEYQNYKELKIIQDILP